MVFRGVEILIGHYLLGCSICRIQKMNEADEAKPSEDSEMDIVSMAFSNVTENSDLMEVVSDDQCGNGGQNFDGAGEMGEAEGNDPVDMPRENGQDHPPTHIEIPLPPNAIITVNEKGEQVIELAQVIEDESELGDMNNQTCVIEHVENVEDVEQIEQIQNVGLNHEEQPGPDEDVPMAVVGGNGLETMAFQPVQVQGQNVGGQACVVPVAMPMTMSLSDVQNLQRAVGAVSVGPGGESVESSSVGVAGISSTTSADLAATASSLMVSLANIIDSGSVLAASSQSLPTVTFVSGAGIPVQSLSNVSNSIGSENTILSTGLVTSNANTTIETNSATGAQFVHSGTTLKAVNMSESVLISQKNQLLNSTQAGTQSVPVISHSQMSDLPPLQKQDPSTAIGNRSVFSPMTLTIRTPPGAPAVNQALINSIVNNTDVQALLKRNPGQPITIVRVPEGPFDRKNVPGVVTTKIVTNNEESSILRHKGGPGRPRKFPPETESNLMPKRKRGRQPGTKLKKDDEEYLVPVSWKPVKSRTRSGRISRPPVYRTNDYRPLKFMERSDQASDAEESSDVEQDVGGRVPVTLTGRVKKYQCRNCSKAYIGRGGLARHFTVEPTHGNIESYELSEVVSPKLEKSPSEDNHKLDQPTTSETPAEETPDVNQESPKSATTPDVETPPSSKGSTPEPEDDAEPEEAVGEPIKKPKPISMGRRGRPPNPHKDDPDFKPGMHTGTPKSTAAKSMDKRKETMRQALKFLNTDDYIDVCLPRLARQLSLWDFLISKTEADKEDIPQVLKVLQLFEELIADVRDMAVNCLEKAEDEDTDIDGILLEEDDDLARVLEFDKGWYKVSAPPLGMPDMQYSVGSVLMKRPMEVIGKDDLVDEESPPSKKPKRESGETSQSCELQTPTQNIPNQQTITVHVHDGKVTSTEKGTPDPSSLKTLVGASKPSYSSTKVLTSDPIPVLIKPDPEEKPSSLQTNQKQPTAPRNLGNQHLLDSSGNDKPVEDNNLAQTQLGAQLQQAKTAAATAVAATTAEETAATVAATGQFHVVAETTTAAATAALTTTAAAAVETPPAPDLVRTDDQHSTQLTSMNMPGPASSEADFVRAVEELTSMSVVADSSLSNAKHTDKPESIHQQVDPSESMLQQESSSSVVVPEGSTIMQMQDGTFLVQKPDGTAMQIHTPEGMTIETVQELLSVEGGQS